MYTQLILLNMYNNFKLFKQRTYFHRSAVLGISVLILLQYVFVKFSINRKRENVPSPYSECFLVCYGLSIFN